MTTPRRPSGARRLTPVQPWPTIGSPDEHVRVEQVRLLYRQAPASQVIALLVAALLAAALWRVTAPGRLVVWLAVLVPVSLARMALVYAYRRRQPQPAQMIVWEWRFVITLVAVSLAWGVGGWWIMSPDSLAHQALVYFFLIGVSGGAVASYGAHPPATRVTISCIMLPATIWFALQNVLELRVMAAGGVMYFVAALRATELLSRFLHRSFQLTWEVQAAHTLAQKLARTDELTGLDNRRAFTEAGRRAIDQARRYNRPLSLIMFDIDAFKGINDTYGHVAGDLVLQEVGDAVRRSARAADVAGRLGGEEFGLLLPETGIADAVALAERLRADLAALAVPYDGRAISFTCSFGVTGWRDGIDRFDALLDEADKALYRAKRQGRNRVSRETESMRDAPP